MAQEIELKLSLDDQDRDRIVHHPLLATGTAPQKFFLRNQYFDTPDQQLTRHGFAIRIRQQGDQLIQTLKGRGTQLSGLHQRLELEWPLATPELDCSLIPAGLLPANIDLATLVPLFETNFDRTQWEITTADASLWIMLDEGRVSCGEKETPISEVEIELHQGDPIALFDVALQLTHRFALVPNDVSKAERGFRLLNNSSVPKSRPPVITAEASLETAFEQVMAFELETLHRLWEAFHYTQNWTHLHQFRNTLGNMRTNFLLFSKMLAPEAIVEASKAIDWLDNRMAPMLHWWPACYALSQQASEPPRSASDQLHQLKALQALDRLSELQREPEFCHHLLSLARWLFAKEWTHHHTDDTRHQAQTQISQALLEPVKQQWLALQLDECGGNVSSWLERQQIIQGLSHIFYLRACCRRRYDPYERRASITRKWHGRTVGHGSRIETG